MFAIIGILVVVGAVLGGYLMEHGNLGVILKSSDWFLVRFRQFFTGRGGVRRTILNCFPC
jgi:flagellar motor component MotA